MNQINMNSFLKKALFTTALTAILAGCVTTSSLNQGFRKIDRMWALEYQKTEDKFRYRVIEAPFDLVYEQIKKTFLDLEMPLIVTNYEQGILRAENEAPKPLTHEEWLRVKEVESPKTREKAGWMFYLPDDPSDYLVTVQAKLLDKGAKTFVILDYKMANPKYEEMGLQPSEYAPPLAVQLGSLKFWDKLGQNLSELTLPKPRKRNHQELYVLLDGGNRFGTTSLVTYYSFRDEL